jgi:hypothetical protein
MCDQLVRVPVQHWHYDELSLRRLEELAARESGADQRLCSLRRKRRRSRNVRPARQSASPTLPPGIAKP